MATIHGTGSNPDSRSSVPQMANKTANVQGSIMYMVWMAIADQMVTAPWTAI